MTLATPLLVAGLPPLQWSEHTVQCFVEVCTHVCFFSTNYHAKSQNESMIPQVLFTKYVWGNQGRSQGILKGEGGFGRKRQWLVGSCIPPSKHEVPIHCTSRPQSKLFGPRFLGRARESLWLYVLGKTAERLPCCYLPGRYEAIGSRLLLSDVLCVD